MKKLLLSGIAFFVIATPASAQWIRQKADPPPQQIVQRVGIDQHLNAQVPLDLAFRDEAGRPVTLGSFFTTRPVVLALVYYDCPMLCNQVLNGLTQALRVMRLEPGRDYEVIAVSFDPTEGPKLAAAKKAAYVSETDRPGAGTGWHFLTGTKEASAALAKAVGFRYEWQEGTRQWAHGAGIMVLTPRGVLSRYFYGIEYGVRDLRLGLVEASNHRIGGLADQLTLLCYQYDPMTGKYGLVVMNSIRAGGVLTVAALGIFITVMLRRERRSARQDV